MSLGEEPAHSQQCLSFAGANTAHELLCEGRKVSRDASLSTLESKMERRIAIACLTVLIGCAEAPPPAAPVVLDTAPRNEPKQAAPRSGESGSPVPTAPSTATAGVEAPTPAAAPVNAQIAGESASTVRLHTVQTEMEKLGWTHVFSNDRMLQGLDAPETFEDGRRVKMHLVMTKARATAKITIVRPVPNHLDRESSLPDAKATAAALYDAAAYLNGDVLFAVEVPFHKDEAQKVIDALVKQ